MKLTPFVCLVPSLTWNSCHIMAYMYLQCHIALHNTFQESKIGKKQVITLLFKA